MGCRNIGKRMLQYVQGMLSAEAARDIDGHVRVCAACREKLAGLQETWKALDGLPAPDAAASMAPEVLRRIDDYERKRSATHWVWLAPFKPSFAGATAAIMIAGFCAGALISSVYYPDNGQAQIDADSVYTDVLSDAPQASFIDFYLQTAGQNSEENSL
jgi:anti-sigma factor RsiW